MLDLKRIESDKEEILKLLNSRSFDLSIIEKVLELNQIRKNLVSSSETKKSEVNKLSRQVGELKKQKLDAEDIIHKVNLLKKEMLEESNLLDRTQTELNSLLYTIPNLPADTVPVGESENDNVELKIWGTPRDFSFGPKDHTDIGEALGLLDFEAGARITG